MQMMGKLRVALLTWFAAFGWLSTQSESKHVLVGYWGQNGAGANFGAAYYERELKDVCINSKFDIINIGFVVHLFDSRNKDNLPGLNFANHCSRSVNQEHPSLLHCPNIADGIRECQSRGKKVTISLGGATGKGILASPQKARVLANNIWQLFLGGFGQGYDALRPFGRVVLDGVDLDIEGGGRACWVDFVKELRRLMNSDSNKRYIISGAPQCPYPDAYLGPMHKDSALQGAGELFDYLYVQFYNNYCWPGDRHFQPILDKWVNFANSRNSMGPKIVLGLPAHRKASGHNKYFILPHKLKTIYKAIRNKPNVEGIMLWDLSWDQNSLVGGKRYSDHAAEILNEDSIKNVSHTTPETPTTKASVSTTAPFESTTTVADTDSPSTPFFTVKPVTSESRTNDPITHGPSTTAAITDNPTSRSPSPTPGVKCSSLFGLFAHPSDLTKFIQCSHGVPYVHSCPAGLHFDDKIKVCNWPTSKSGACANAPDGYQAHPTDPTKFIQCVRGVPHTQTCPTLLVFNKATNVCDWP